MFVPRIAALLAVPKTCLINGIEPRVVAWAGGKFNLPNIFEVYDVPQRIGVLRSGSAGSWTNVRLLYREFPGGKYLFCIPVDWMPPPPRQQPVFSCCHVVSRRNHNYEDEFRLQTSLGEKSMLENSNQKECYCRRGLEWPAIPFI